MTLPVFTTSIRVMRQNRPPNYDPGESDLPYDVIASGVAAVISSPSGREAGGSQEIIAFRLNCSPTDLDHLDRVENEKTGALYEVAWATAREGYGAVAPYTQADLRQITGTASGP